MVLMGIGGGSLRFWSLWLTLGGLFGCMPKVQVEVLQPAAVTFPAQLKTLAVVDRSRPANLGQAVLGAIEGLITGEPILGDREGASRAMESVITTVRASPRFEAAVPVLTKEQSETDIFDKELSWAAAERIARKAKADAIVALEAFDTDSSVTFRTDQESYNDNGVSKERTVHTAIRSTNVLAAWRVYDVQSRTLIDDYRDRAYTNSWEATGNSRAAALAGLATQVFTIETLGAEAGAAYGRRIAPSYVYVTRAYYGKGSERLVEAKAHVRSGDWDGAAKIWTAIVENGRDPKILGRAKFNLALASEISGDLAGAIDWAKQAGVELRKRRAYNYSALLSQRLADKRLVDEQMAAPPEVPETRPSKSGSGQKSRPR